MGLIARIAAALVTGGLLAQVYGLHPLWPLAWIAPIPLLIACYGASRVMALFLGLLAGLLSTGGMFAYLLSLGGPVPLAIVVSLKAVCWGAMALAARGAVQRLPNLAAAFVFPASLAAIETASAQFSPHGSAGSLAYSQMDFLPAIQSAALGGAPAVAFLIALFASAVSLALWRRDLVAAITPVLIVGAALAWGWTRFPAQSAPSESRTLRVAALADDQFNDQGIPHAWRPVWSAYAPQIERAAANDHRIVLLPEKIAFLSEQERDAAVGVFSALARQHDIVIVAGFDVAVGDKRYNRAYVFRPDEETIAYDKRHMVPGFESYFALGTGPLTFERGSARLGVAICKDMDFPELGRNYPGARLMLVPAWDFGVDRWLHSRMAILRGVENGYTIVRSARDGVLTVSDRYGRVIAERPSAAHAVLEADAPLGAPGPTLYERIGDAFGWACAALFVLLFGWSLMPGKTEREEGANAD